ncbi:MFS transporter [Streptomyces sp. NPDC056600]|uniref:MFS transporter n=1 Tax=Streptomyces sp. NPDC056600 TaxID=3345874 RepID=UPI0036BDE009
MSETVLSEGRDPQQASSDNRRWRALFFISLAQLMVALDATIVNIALPAAQHDLGISDGNRQWVITAYGLAFGGLLLFGGRVGDLWGRKRAFTIGLIGFALASAVGGAAQNEATLLGARALQGVFGALLAPAALSLLAVMFTDGKERAKAFGIYGAITGGGGAVGLILGGFLTEYLNWRYTFFVNVPFAIVAGLGAILVIREPAGGRNHSPLDIPGVVLATLGLVSLVYGFAHAESSGWSDATTIGLFVASVVLLVAFVVTEAKVKAPLLPLRVVTDRNRGGVFLSLGLAVIGLFGLFLFLTFYLQIVRGYSPVKTGFAFLPAILGIIVGSTQIGARLMPRVAPRLLLGPGFLLAAIGMLLLTQMTNESSYAGLLLPGSALVGVGIGMAFTPAIVLATHGVEAQDAGVASAMANVSQQLGGAIGTALLNTIAATATTSYLAAHAAASGSDGQLLQSQGLVHGYVNGFWAAFGILAAASVIAFVFITIGRPGAGAPDAPSSTEEAGTGASDDPHVPVIAD